MIKYLLGFVAGMVVVPFVYILQTVNELSLELYVILLIAPIIIIAVTIYLANNKRFLKQ